MAPRRAPPKYGRMWFFSSSRSPRLVFGRSFAVVAHQASAQSTKDDRRSVGSTQSPRCRSAPLSSKNRSASNFRANVRDLGPAVGVTVTSPPGDLPERTVRLATTTLLDPCH